MKLYGSLINRIAEEATPKSPEIGMGVTELCYSDRHPYTVIAILSPTRLLVTPDRVTRLDKNGFSEEQEYSYETQWELICAVELRLNAKGQWKRKGDAKGNTYLIGRREEYYDFTF